MSDNEKLHVKLGISGTYWKKVPEYNILFNGSIIKSGAITAPTDEVEYFEFDLESSLDQSVLGIELTNKEDSDTIIQKDDINPNKYEIISDMTLNIVSIEIDECSLGILPYTLGVYTVNTAVDYKGDGVLVKDISLCTNLGWNGVWHLTWTNPFYLWLLESL